ncbi:MAG: glycoside hydrolase family 5 protein [Mycobacteriales bacterium]
MTGDKPSWGDGNPATDWKRAAELGGDAVLAANPDLLVIIGGLEFQGNLNGAYDDPARLSVPHRIVYAAHDYVFFHNDAENADYQVFQAAVERNWGKVLQPGHAATAPVYVSEFGACTKGGCTLKDLRYIRFITRYLDETDTDWAYWPVNGTQSEGYSRQHGASETYGLLDDTWRRGSNDLVLARLLTVQRAEQGPGITRRREP